MRTPVASSEMLLVSETNGQHPRPLIATDPPYYDNIGYADLSDFFYVWQRRTLHDVWPDLFRRVLVPKDEELVATPYRHGGKDEAEQFFMDGMGKALANMHASGTDEFPVTIYYAFKQAETAKEGLTSPGWATFLQADIRCGLCHRRHMACQDGACQQDYRRECEHSCLVHSSGVP